MSTEQDQASTVDEVGTCACGKSSITIKGGFPTNKTGIVCYCTTCQKLGGGFGTYVTGLPRESVAVAGDEVKTWHNPGKSSGNPVDMLFCGECGSNLVGYPAHHQQAFVKLALFGNKLKPGLELYKDMVPEFVPSLLKES
ncbi:hypothetical protein PUNSTDRAFT_118522 [Punctularia strigosozonata HHB-11173 SS5]|uniref:uncharacterized protein n=1 Tax=Punctularia strigosozonata (strain HHB-11173) TaxID=741275 RepID=UPI000441638E|nr:uncharacterized protein PUNSTDRAFT_118522 [Punctularia strigosozonata HHB-11173 SS5]EIN12836.1 hypothetical protein PUNSTDRAFT_118522 [Punctularia strigosozonata HHB-11173 SS5]